MCVFDWRCRASTFLNFELLSAKKKTPQQFWYILLSGVLCGKMFLTNFMIFDAPPLRQTLHLFQSTDDLSNVIMYTQFFVATLQT